MVSLTQPLGPYFDFAGAVTPGGALQLLDPQTDLEKVAYYNIAETIPTSNPLVMGSDGRLQAEVYLGLGDYKVRQWMLVDPLNSTPAFPADYAFVREWLTPGRIAVTSTVSLLTVGTMAELSALDPVVDATLVQVTGYYTANDNVPPRMFAWIPYSTLSVDGGSVVAATGHATGRWLLKYDSPVIDIRWFGAIPGHLGAVNSSFTAAAAFAAASGTFSSPKTLYIPYGTYQVSAGVVASSASLKVDDGAKLFVTTAGTYTVNVTGRFDIRLSDTLNHIGGTGVADFSFASNVAGAEAGDVVDCAWWAAGLTDAITAAGNCPIIATTAQTVSSIGADYTVSRLIIRGIGSAAFTDTAHLITVAELDAPQGTQVITGSSAANPCVAFGGRVYSSTVSADVIRWATGTRATLVMDADRGMGAFDCSLSWGLIQGAGGKLVTSAGRETTVYNIDGKVHSCVGTVLGSVAVGDFHLEDSVEILGFVRSAMAVNGQADFGGLYLTHSLDVDEFDAVLIEDASFGAGLLFRTSGAVQTVVLKRCGISSSTAGEYVSLTMTDCTWAQTGATERFRGDIVARDCTLAFTGTITGTNISLTDCETSFASGEGCTFDTVRVDGGSFIGLAPSGCSVNSLVSYWGANSLYRNVRILPEPDWDINLSNNRFENSFVVFSGSGTMLGVYITDNAFINSASLGLYEPINIDDMTVTSFAYGTVGISGNTPKSYVSKPKLSSGIAVRQTTFEIQHAVGIAINETAFKSLETDEQNYAFAPWLELGMRFGFGLHTFTPGTYGGTVMEGSHPLLTVVTDTASLGYNVFVPALDHTKSMLTLYP